MLKMHHIAKKARRKQKQTVSNVYMERAETWKTT